MLWALASPQYLLIVNNVTPPRPHASSMVLLLLCSVAPGMELSAPKYTRIEVFDFAELPSIMVTGSERPVPARVGQCGGPHPDRLL